MRHGVFINQRKSNCSIYESGLVIKNILRENPKDYTLDFIETDLTLSGMSTYKYDFHVVNWHPHTLAVGKARTMKMRNRIAIVVEVSPDNNLPFTPDWFDAYMIIDPTKKREGKFYPFPRPIIPYPVRPLLDKSKFVLGSFGLYAHQFADEKRFTDIVREANKSRLESIVRINLPIATFTSTPLTAIKDYGRKLKRLAKSNVEVIVTHDYMENDKLVGWLSEHNMNCFPYYRSRPGLAAVADQAISAGRAIMTTECDTFTHLHKYINYYPKESYRKLAESTLDGVQQMKEDWSPAKFKETFDNMLREMGVI